MFTLLLLPALACRRELEKKLVLFTEAGDGRKRLQWQQILQEDSSAPGICGAVLER